MTSKHFRAFAETISHIKCKKTRKMICEKACELSSAENPRFDADRFRKACKLED